jgi:hypothetical protein
MIQIEEDVYYPSAGTQSNLAAAHNPIRVKLRRMDMEVSLTRDDGTGKTEVELASTPSVPLTVGQKVYVSSGYINGSYTILSWSGSNLLVIDLPYDIDTGTGYINFLYDYKNYYVRVVIRQADVTNTIVAQYEANLIPFTDGYVEFDFMPYAKLSVTSEKPNQNIYDSTTYRVWADETGSAQLGAFFYENYNGVEQPLGEYANTSVIVTNAAMYHTHVGGFNLAESYAPAFYPSGTVGRFLTVPGKLRVWGSSAGSNDPFGPLLLFHFLGFNFTPAIQWKRYRADGGLLGANYATVNTIGVGTSGGNIGYPHFVNIKLPDIYSSPFLSYYTVQIFNPATMRYYSELLTVRVSCMPRNPVYIRAINRYGSFSYFVFSGNQATGIITKLGTQFSRTPEDTFTIDVDSRLLGKTMETEITLGADDLDDDDLAIVEAILTSPFVLMYRPTADNPNPEPTQWEEVKILPGTFALGNRKVSRHRVEFKIQPSSKNIQTL